MNDLDCAGFREMFHTLGNWSQLPELQSLATETSKFNLEYKHCATNVSDYSPDMIYTDKGNRFCSYPDTCIAALPITNVIIIV